METTKKSYEKFYVKRNPANGKFMIEGAAGKPVDYTGDEKGEVKPIAGEKIRDCRITEATAEELNEIALRSGRMYVLDEKAQAELDKPGVDEQKAAEEAEKTEIWAKLTTWKEEGKLDKLPNVNTGLTKLRIFVEENEPKEE